MGGGGGSKGGGGSQPLQAVPIQQPQTPPMLLGQNQTQDTFQKLMDELFSRMKAREIGVGNLGFAPENQQNSNIEI